MDILLWILPLLLGPPAIAAFVWLERLPTTRPLAFARIATWPLAGRMCAFVFTLVMCGHSLLLIPAMLAGLGDVASRLWMWQADAAILLVCLVAAVPAALGLGSPHRSVGAQLASWLCMTTAIACVTLGLTAVLPWSCDVDLEARSGPDCRPPAQLDFEKRQDQPQFISIVGRVGSLGAIFGGFLSGLGAVLTPTQWVHRWQPSPRTTASGAQHAIRQVLTLLPEEVSSSSALRGGKQVRRGLVSGLAARRAIPGAAATEHVQHIEPAFATNSGSQTQARHRNGNRNRGQGGKSNHQLGGASAGFRHASTQERPSSQEDGVQQSPTAGQLMQLRQTTRLMASCAELQLMTTSETATPSASCTASKVARELADMSSIGTRAGLEAAVIDLAGWDEQLDRAIEMESGSWLGWGKSTAGMGLALVGVVRGCLAAFNLATGRRPERDPLTTAALLATRTMRAIGLAQSAGVLGDYGDGTGEVGEVGPGPGGGGSLLGWALETASLCVVATLVAVGLRGLVTNGRKLAAALGVGSTVAPTASGGGGGGGSGRAAVGPTVNHGKRPSKQPGLSLPKLLEGSPEQALDRLTEASARRRMAAGTLGVSATWLALAMIPFTLGQLVLLRMQVPAWHRGELEAMLGPLRFGWFHAAFDAAFLVGIAVAGVSVWMSPSVSHGVAHDSGVVSGAAGAHAGVLGIV